MRKKLFLLNTFPFLGLIMLTTAHAQIFSDRDVNVDLNQYKTYAWIAPGDSVLNRQRRDKLFGGFIMYSANQELKAKGMVIDTLRPNAVIVFHTQVQEKTKYTQSPTLSVGVGVAGPGYYVGGMAPVAGGEIKASNYQDGMLSFEMYDTKTGNLLWTGGDKKSFSYSDDIEKIISDSVKKIFKKLPIKHKKTK